MTDHEPLRTLLRRNEEHTESLKENHFDEVLESQHPEVISVCCSDSRVSQEGMWSVDRPGWLFAPSNIGNQAWDTVGDDKVVNGSLLYPVKHTETETVAVVGHTGCGAVTAAYKRLSDESNVVDEDGDDATVINRLVEYNVRRQVDFLIGSDDVPSTVDVYGFVYDFQRVYGDVPGRTYLVSSNGRTEGLEDEVPEEYEDWVRSLL
ncbi:MAG: carbonic anhydrase [Halobacteria archaeon]|nr:carbonic anhydrase [Halobacteria archaeon]